MLKKITTIEECVDKYTYLVIIDRGTFIMRWNEEEHVFIGILGITTITFSEVIEIYEIVKICNTSFIHH